MTRPATEPAVRWQDLAGSPSSKTVHAPQAPSPQPSFGPVKPTWSRSTVSSTADAGTDAVVWLTAIVMFLPAP